MVLVALPCFRYWFHNSFEIVHRYLSWLALAFLLTHVTLVNIHQHPNLETFWSNTPVVFAAFLLILTVYPWVIMHRISGEESNYDVYLAEDKTSVALVFKNVSSPIGAVCKLSIDWVEFHVMGITPLPDGSSLVLMKDLGDWTHRFVQLCETGEIRNRTIWLTRIKPPNFTQGLCHFERVFVLVTGSGVAPLIPYVANQLNFQLAISLVWVARDHYRQYPKFVTDYLDNIPNVEFYDTSRNPRVNLSVLSLKKAREFGAQAVFIVSNPSLAYEISTYVTKAGIPAFASNFDV